MSLSKTRGVLWRASGDQSGLMSGYPRKAIGRGGRRTAGRSAGRGGQKPLK